MCCMSAGQGEKLGEVQAHRGPISSLQLLANSKTPFLLTAGKLDHVARLHQVEELAGGSLHAPNVKVGGLEITSP